MTSPSTDLIVGTYRGSGGRGLYPLRYDAVADRWAVGTPVATVANASFGVQAQACTYLVDEAAGTIAAYRTGWNALSKRMTGTDTAPCHLALHPSQAWLAVANYQDGSIAVLPVDPQSGALRDPVTVHRLIGCGPDAQRQASPHAHWVGFDAAGTTLYCVDLGTDRVLAFAFDAGTGAIGDPVVAYTAPGGSGPRHLLFHPLLPLAYLVSEMAGTLTVLHRRSATDFTRGVILPTQADAAANGMLAGGMLLHAGCLYVTNRGNDSIARFTLDALGQPSWRSEVPSGGRSPRFLFAVHDHARLLVAHEGGAVVTAFTVAADGALSDPVAIPIPGAAFIAYAPSGG